MVTQHEGMNAVRDTIRRDARIPDEMSFVVHEADPDGQQANVALPAIEIQNIGSSEDNQTNSELYGYIEDDDGNRVGRIYETKWEMELQIDIWTSDGSSYDVNELGEIVHAVLYDHHNKGPDKPFETDDGEPIDLIWNFQLLNQTREDDLANSPTLRRWRQRATMNGAQRLRETGLTSVKTVSESTTT